MRTTIRLDDDILAFAKRYSESRSLNLGKAISDLVRRGIDAPPRTKIVNGIHVFDVPPDSPKVTTEHVLRLEDDEI